MFIHENNISVHKKKTLNCLKNSLRNIFLVWPGCIFVRFTMTLIFFCTVKQLKGSRARHKMPYLLEAPNCYAQCCVIVFPALCCSFPDIIPPPSNPHFRSVQHGWRWQGTGRFRRVSAPSTSMSEPTDTVASDAPSVTAGVSTFSFTAVFLANVCGGGFFLDVQITSTYLSDKQALKSLLLNHWMLSVFMTAVSSAMWSIICLWLIEVLLLVIYKVKDLVLVWCTKRTVGRSVSKWQNLSNKTHLFVTFLKSGDSYQLHS